MIRGFCLFISIFALGLASSSQSEAAPRPLSPFAPGFGNGCQTRTLCASIERLGLYVGASLQGALTDSAASRESALGGTLSLGFDFVRRVAIEAHFATAALRSAGEPLQVAAGPLTVGARLRLGPHASTLFSEKQPPLRTSSAQVLSKDLQIEWLRGAAQPGPGGVSPVGRALQKHAARPRSTFAGATGNAKQNTERGVQYLKDILEHPESATTWSPHPVHGEVVKVRLPNGQGAWFKSSGEFIGFLEPYTPTKSSGR